MARGSKIVCVRFEPELWAKVEAAIESANVRRFEGSYDVSEWIRQAVREKLDKLVRGNRPRGKDRL